MTFGREVRNQVGPKVGDCTTDGLRVTDVALDETITAVPTNASDLSQRAGLGQIIENYRLVTGVFIRCRMRTEQMKLAPPVTTIRLIFIP